MTTRRLKKQTNKKPGSTKQNSESHCGWLALHNGDINLIHIYNFRSQNANYTAVLDAACFQHGKIFVDMWTPADFYFV